RPFPGGPPPRPFNGPTARLRPEDLEEGLVVQDLGGGTGHDDDARYGAADISVQRQGRRNGPPDRAGGGPAHGVGLSTAQGSPYLVLRRNGILRHWSAYGRSVMG